MLNFLPAPAEAVAAMAARVRTGGTVAAYVWDYAEGMQLLRIFWDSAIMLDPAAQELDEGRRFPLCRADAFRELFRSAGLRDVLLRPIVQDTLFPTICYVAGPSELAYLGQLRGVYDHFGVPMPLMYPRATATILDACRIARSPEPRSRSPTSKFTRSLLAPGKMRRWAGGL